MANFELSSQHMRLQGGGNFLLIMWAHYQLRMITSLGNTDNCAQLKHGCSPCLSENNAYYSYVVG